MKKNELLESIKKREATCWVMTQTFIDNRDPHGCHDMGVEIQALQRAIIELGKIDD